MKQLHSQGVSCDGLITGAEGVEGGRGLPELLKEVGGMVGCILWIPMSSTDCRKYFSIK